jgi:UDP-N-acetylglucosamine--N-acetylmuramyl-(pentapeptide) pyrophosphoryl-undecaprenol N-acetylglucosamine transferase
MKYFPTRPCEVTGTPIRASLAQRLDKAQAIAAFGLSSERRTLLVMGGSQGAQGINRALREAAMLCGTPAADHHLTGQSRMSRRCATRMLRPGCRRLWRLSPPHGGSL